MKHIFLQLSTLFFTALAFQATAQVTITHDNFPRLAEFLDSGHVVLDPGIVIPSGGADQVWDYSSLPQSNFGTQLYVDATNDPDFPDALQYFQANLNLNVGGSSYEIPSKSYYAVDENGWYRTGRSFESMSVSLTPISGGAEDRIDYPENNFDYVGRLDIIKFPLNYQDQWTETSYYDLNYEVTAGAFGLNQTPAFTRTYRTEDREVIGHGLLTIPKSDATPSEPMDVLLVKAIFTTVDSFFLGGSPAPQTLLDVLGLAQGVTTQDSFYVFYKPDFGAPVILFEMVENNQAGRTVYRSQAADFNTAIQELNLTKIQSFPNPVSAGSLITIPIEQLTSSGAVRFFNLQGQLLHTITFKSVLDNQLQLEVPTTIGSGIFMYQVLDKKNIPLGLGKLQVF